jgi:ABC-type Fe3+-siderophore transport system permease subunit
MIRVTDQYFWNIIFILFYAGLLTMAAIILNTEARMPYADLSILDLTLISLASFRLTRMFVYDSMTKFLREQFWDVKMVRNKVMLVKPVTGPRRTLADLMGCPWCFGVWATTCVAFFYLLTPYAYFPILILALSGVATMLQLFANMVGWKAEQLKRETEGE